MKNTSRKKEEKNKCNASYLKYSCAVNMLIMILNIMILEIIFMIIII